MTFPCIEISLVELNNEFLVRYSDHNLINKPFDYWTDLDHLNPGLVRYSDRDCTKLLHNIICLVANCHEIRAEIDEKCKQDKQMHRESNPNGTIC